MGDPDAVQPLVWMRAVRDSGEFCGLTLAVLLSLALRMTKQGVGFASQLQLADDLGVSESTAYRALKAARDTGYLVQTRRGHRVTDGTTLASEYCLTQPVTRDRLEGEGQPVTRAGLEGQTKQSQPVNDATQPVTRDGPRGLHPRVLSLGDRSTDVDVPSFSETEIVNVAARILGAEHDIDEEAVADLWDAWNDATPAQKAWARGQARQRLRDDPSLIEVGA